MAAGVAPQSSCSFRPHAPAAICSTRPEARLALPLPKMPTLIGNASAACSMRCMCHGPGVHVVAVRPAPRPGPPPHSPGGAGIERLLDLLRADEVYVHVDATGSDNLAFTRDRLSAGSDDDVDIGLDVGIAGLADRRNPSVLDGDVRLHDSPMIKDQRVRDDR